jgi:signal transduction histidine kinase
MKLQALRSDIRYLMSWVVLIPVLFTGLIFTAGHVYFNTQSLHAMHQEKLVQSATQLASAVEFALFTDNRPLMESLALGVLQEEDMVSAKILNAQGDILVARITPLATQAQDPTDTLRLPVRSGLVPLDDLVSMPQPSGMAEAARRGALQGYVELQMSRQTLNQQLANMVVVSTLLLVLGCGLGLAVAFWLARKISQPIGHISHMVEQIGQGELGVRLNMDDHDVLGKLKLGLNQMADNVEQARTHLEQQIALATRELRAQKEHAESATQAKSRFLESASHDLRQPLYALSMFVARLDQLTGPSHDPELAQLVGYLKQSAAALQALLDSLLDLSRLEGGLVQAHVQAFAVQPLLQQVLDTLRPLADEKGLELSLKGAAIWVESDPALLTRIVLNLVGNALRYTEQGRVLVACRSAQGGRVLRVEVWDTGVGIAPEYLSQIFGEYFQAHTAPGARIEGVGLGLTIVQRTAQLLGHRLSVRSVLGKGSCFAVELPQVQAAQAGQLASSLDRQT